MDAISACAYGINPGSINNLDHPIVTHAKRMLSEVGGFRILLLLLAPWLAKLLKVELFDTNSVDYFDELTKQILKERKAMRKHLGVQCKCVSVFISHHIHYHIFIAKRRTDFIQLMIDSEKSDNDLGYNNNIDGEPDPESTDTATKRPTNGKMTADEMAAQGIAFFFAGFDTTAAALTHAIFYLSVHPECQQILYDELKTCEDFTYETLVHLKYLNAVINETLRLTPSITRMQRECLQDYNLGNTGITIPKGASVEIYPYAIHQDPDYWPNPNDFLPDRWFKPSHHPCAYLPFGGGPRICVGQRFAISVMRVCLAKLIYKFEFTLAQTHKLEYYLCNPVMSPKKLQ
ncbi:unnamed protein product, partial [Oppiella nova]